MLKWRILSLNVKKIVVLCRVFKLAHLKSIKFVLFYCHDSSASKRKSQIVQYILKLESYIKAQINNVVICQTQLGTHCVSKRKKKIMQIGFNCASTGSLTVGLG